MCCVLKLDSNVKDSKELNSNIYKEWLQEYAKTDLLGLNYTAVALFFPPVLYLYLFHVDTKLNKLIHQQNVPDIKICVQKLFTSVEVT